MTKSENKKATLTELSTKQMQEMIVNAIQDKKGRGISVLDLSSIETAPAMEFIICEGRTPQQVGAIADNIREELLDKARVKPYNYDGYG